MLFNKIFLISIVSLAGAAPAPAAKAATLGSTARSYKELSIAGGTAGNAAAEAAAKYPFTADQFATVTKAQLAILKQERETEEAAETDAFNQAVDGATGTAKTSLQAGKIKNKVLKLTFEVNNLKIDEALGNADAASQIAAEQKKLDNNIAIDKKSAGTATTDVDFNGTG